MSNHKLVGRDAQEAREFVPQILKAFHDGLQVVDGLTLKLNGIPAPQAERGGFTFDLGALEIHISSGKAHAWLSGKTVTVGENVLQCSEPVPRILPVVNGISIRWEKAPKVVTSFLTKLAGATIEEILLFSDHADIRVGNGPDQIVEW